MEKCSSPSSSSSINGLKFGKKIYFEDMGSGTQAKAGQPAPPSPAKKGRSGAAEPPRCQVEGCKVDLSDAKAYYSKHKVCSMHSKSPKVTVAGIEQRFCQQCSRFHQLPEFDQGKRSCRRRLAGHNERRRKPSPGSLLSSPYGNSHSQTGGALMDFSAYLTFSGRNSWPNAVLENQAAIAGRPELTWLSSPQVHLPDLLQGTSTQPRYSSSGIPSEERFNGVSDSSSALSLLSNHPWSSKPCFEANNFLGIGGATSTQPSINADVAIGQFASPLGLGQAAHPASSQYAGELGLAQPGDRQVGQSSDCGSSFQHMHWSL